MDQMTLHVENGTYIVLRAWRKRSCPGFARWRWKRAPPDRHHPRQNSDDVAAKAQTAGSIDCSPRPLLDATKRLGGRRGGLPCKEVKAARAARRAPPDIRRIGADPPAPRLSRFLRCLASVTGLRQRRAPARPKLPSTIQDGFTCQTRESPDRRERLGPPVRHSFMASSATPPLLTDAIHREIPDPVGPRRHRRKRRPNFAWAPSPTSDMTACMALLRTRPALSASGSRGLRRVIA